MDTAPEEQREALLREVDELVDEILELRERDPDEQTDQRLLFLDGFLSGLAKGASLGGVMDEGAVIDYANRRLPFHPDAPSEFPWRTG